MEVKALSQPRAIRVPFGSPVDVETWPGFQPPHGELNYTIQFLVRPAGGMVKEVECLNTGPFSQFQSLLEGGMTPTLLGEILLRRIRGVVNEKVSSGNEGHQDPSHAGS